MPPVGERTAAIEPPLAIVASAIRRERLQAGLSQSELARRSGVAKSTLSQIEAGSGNPGVETLWAIASAMQLPISRLFESSAAKQRLIRAGDGVRIESEVSDFIGTLLNTAQGASRRDIYWVDMQPGSSRPAAAHPSGTVEHLLLCRGRARVGPLAAIEILLPGDYFAFPGDVDHLYEALEVDTAFVLIMEST